MKPSLLPNVPIKGFGKGKHSSEIVRWHKGIQMDLPKSPVFLVFSFLGPFISTMCIGVLSFFVCMLRESSKMHFLFGLTISIFSATLDFYFMECVYKHNEPVFDACGEHAIGCSISLRPNLVMYL